MRVLVLLGVLTGLIGPGCHRPLVGSDWAKPVYPPPPSRSTPEVDRILTRFGASADGTVPVKAGQPVDPDVLDQSTVLRLALENDPTVIDAKARLAQARARSKTSSAWPNPELDGRVVMDGDAKVSVEAAFLFSFPIGGRVGAAEELAASGLDRARLRLRTARSKALVETRRRLARIAWSRARLELFSSMADRSRQYADLARSRREAGISDALDVALVLADATADRSAERREQTRLHRLEQSLRLSIGLPPDQGVLRVDPLSRIRVVEKLADLEESALESNPQVLMTRLDVLVADARAARVAAERIPDLQAGPALVVEGGTVAGGLALAIPIPLLQSGRGPYEEALATRSLALETHQLAMRKARADATSIFLELSSLQAELEVLQSESTVVLEESLRLAEVRYRAGKLDVLRLLAIHRAFTELKLQVLEILIQQGSALFDLDALIGRAAETVEVNP